MQERRPIIVGDVTKEQDYMYPDMAKKEGLCSLLSVPMMVREKAVGVINSYTSVPHAFTGEEVKLPAGHRQSSCDRDRTHEAPGKVV